MAALWNKPVLVRGTAGILRDGSLQMVLLNEKYCFHPPAGKKVRVRPCMHAETTWNTDFVLPLNPG